MLLRIAGPMALLGWLIGSVIFSHASVGGSLICTQTQAAESTRWTTY